MKRTKNNDKKQQKTEKVYWLDAQSNVTKVYWGVVIVCGILFLSDAFYKKHPYFAFEKMFGFYGVYGFVACVALVIAAKGLRKLLIREETFYEHQAEKHKGEN